MLINSLICAQGQDSSLRFIAIAMSCYFIVLFWLGLFGANAAILFPILGVGVLLWLSGYRRMRDAQKPLWWSSILLLPWSALAVSFYVQAEVSVWLSIVLLGLTTVVGLAFPSSRSSGRFEMGYQGPAITASRVHWGNASQSRASRRVEPSLGNVEAEDTIERKPAPENTWEVPSQSSSINIEARLRSVIAQLPFTKQQLSFGTIACLLLCTVSLLSFKLLSSRDTQPVDSEVVETSALDAVEPAVTTVEFDDGFSLMLQGDRLLMNWLGDEGRAETLWELATAKGDRDCQSLRFNSGSQYRPMIVERLADSSTQAVFTPLDTQSIIKDVAKRSRVTLCGYSFRLKGTQATLSKSPEFREYLD